MDGKHERNRCVRTEYLMMIGCMALKLVMIIECIDLTRPRGISLLIGFDSRR